MDIFLTTPTVAEVSDCLDELGQWQQNNVPQLHPGDIGWFWRFGAQKAAAAIRIWRRKGEIVAIGLLDGSDLLRLTIKPSALRDPQLAEQLLVDVRTPDRGVLPAGNVNIEAPMESLFQQLLANDGWTEGESWTPLVCSLTEPVESPGACVKVVNEESIEDRISVQREAFQSSSFTEEKWRSMANGAAYSNACCLVAYNDQGAAVATATVWSAGEGRPGLLEPMGVHQGYRGQGFGKAICIAAAAHLQRLGSSGVMVATPSSNVGAVATYKSAGFEALPIVSDRCRKA